MQSQRAPRTQRLSQPPTAALEALPIHTEHDRFVVVEGALQLNSLLFAFFGDQTPTEWRAQADRVHAMGLRRDERATRLGCAAGVNWLQLRSDWPPAKRRCEVRSPLLGRSHRQQSQAEMWLGSGDGRKLTGLFRPLRACIPCISVRPTAPEARVQARQSKCAEAVA